MPDLLVEIGCEEIPARFTDGAMQYLSSEFQKRLKEQRIAFGEAQVFGTPRRLALILKDVATTQSDHEELLVGPPARIAFDADGKPTKAALGFAKKNGLNPEALQKGEVEGKKGEYLRCLVEHTGRPSHEVLPEVLTSLIANWPWGKSMRWGAMAETFVRPLRWLVFLLGKQVLPVTFAGIHSGSKSYGHRFLSEGSFEVDVENYSDQLRKHYVMVDATERRKLIEAGLASISEGTLRVREDKELVAEVSQLVEWPEPVVGTFDEAFLSIPDEVIVSAMRSHQRYFACENEKGLTNSFVTIAATKADDMELIRKGNEKVLVARLSDAKFFYDEDLKTGLQSMGETLSSVLYHKQLGTMGERVQRLGKLAKLVSQEIGGSDVVERAAAICKSDLSSKMVSEFPDLQGVMGRYYATVAGEPGQIAQGIEEHYLPRFAGDTLPTSDVGTALAVADRFDMVVGGFAGNLKPTGSADQFGLRRASIALLTLLAAKKSTLSVASTIDNALGLYREQGKFLDRDVSSEVFSFLTQRMNRVLGEQYRSDLISAVLSAGWDNVADVKARLSALSKFSTTAEFSSLAAGLKRVSNIVKGHDAGSVDQSIFSEAPEKSLWKAFSSVQNTVSDSVASQQYDVALAKLSELKEPIDQFFDKVLVMDKEESIRNNRLNMLANIRDAFGRIADFRQVNTEES